MASHYFARNTVYVEGRDDLFTIVNLLEKSGFQQRDDPKEVHVHPAVLADTGFGRDELIKLVPTAVKASTGKAVAFVIDADKSAKSTWQSIREHICDAVGSGFILPQVCPKNGLVQDIPPLRSRLGVWIMPDNSSPGILEDFLKTLVKKDDRLLPLAQSSTSAAIDAGATFTGSAKPKALIHTWLAWQEKPGSPFGTAIKSNYFDHNSASGEAFVSWMKRLIA